MEAVGGQDDDAGGRDGIEPDQGIDDACFPRNGVVVEAASELVVEVFFVKELGRVPLGRPGDGELAGEASQRPCADDLVWRLSRSLFEAPFATPIVERVAFRGMPCGADHLPRVLVGQGCQWGLRSCLRE
ncbi:hypothetical protein [Streptomyces nodosus]|uniref:hypothetical protein n=1 Tax=Streptomyces nodosus TaxID=40318 RepID=UPI00382DBF3C